LDIEIRRNNLQNCNSDWIFWQPDIVQDIDLKVIKNKLPEFCDVVICGYHVNHRTIMPVPESEILNKSSFPIILSRRSLDRIGYIYNIFAYIQWKVWIRLALSSDLRIGFIYEPICSLDLELERDYNPIVSFHVYKAINQGSKFDIPNIILYEIESYANINTSNPLFCKVLNMMNVKHSNNSPNLISNVPDYASTFDLDYRYDFNPRRIRILDQQSYKFLLNCDNLNFFKYLITYDQQIS